MRDVAEAAADLHPVNALRPAYVFTLVLIGALILTSSMVSEYAVSRYNRANSIAADHATQLIRSQQIALLVSDLARSGGIAEQKEGRDALLALLQALGRSNTALGEAARSGDDWISANLGLRELVLEGPHSVFATVQEFHALTRQAITRGDGVVGPREAGDLALIAMNKLVPLLSRAILLARAEAIGTQSNIRRVGYAALGMITVLIIAVFVTLLRPLSTTARGQAEHQARLLAQLQHQAKHDPLTDLPNRTSLSEFIGRLWRERRSGEERFAICHVNLARFKAINDNYGHAEGDSVLRKVAEILRHETRSDDFIARVGGDEFVVVVPHMRGEVEVVSLLDRVAKRIAEPVRLGRSTARVGTNIGIAISRQGEESGEALLIGADLAAQAAKRVGGDRCFFFSEEMRVEEIARNRLRDQLDPAIDSGQIIAYFQPQLDLATDRVVGFEALARWNHPELGVLTPARFIGLAEEAGAIESVGRTIIRSSLDALQRWRRAGFDVPSIGINVSGREIRDARFVDWLKFEVELRDLEPDSIAIELLETILVESEDDVLVTHMRMLSNHGFRIDLDDFGTGHASLSNLLRMKIDRIKIDRSFISGIESMARQRRLTSTMITMARSLELEVLAEGVESAEEIDTVRQLGCDLVQGYAVARPMDAQAALEWLQARSEAAGKALSA